MVSGVISEFTCLCIHLQDTSGSKAKDQLAAPSPVQITAAAPASVHGKLLPLSRKSIPPAAQAQDCLFKLHCVLFFPAVHSHPHAAPTSALLPVMTAVAPQPGMPGSSHAFQVKFPKFSTNLSS